jgi:stage II sporulation protein D
MKKFFAISLILFVSMLVCPLAALDLGDFSFENVRRKIAVSLQEDVSEEGVETVSESNIEAPETVKVMASVSGEINEVELREYLIGCVACEMPPTYETEALKAQAVAAYTNLVRLKKTPDASLDGADISDSPSKHQGYFDEATQREKYGDKYGEYRKKLEAAVDAVKGEVITFNGEPIVAAYCAVSTGRTEDAAAIWSGDVPYLKSVNSTADKLSPDCSATVVMSAEQVRQALSADSEIKLGDDPSSWFSEMILSDNKTGAVKSLNIGGKTLSGNAARKLLGLRSPSFTCDYSDGSFTFVTQGYGHLVGMSQYGANYMAQTGSSYKEILLHYYKGVKIEQL